jgi:hypothetical protein
MGDRRCSLWPPDDLVDEERIGRERPQVNRRGQIVDSL